MTITTKAPPAIGVLFVIAAPSGGGKSSMVNALLAREPGIRLSISWTTRTPRPGESEGQHYHFVAEEEFRALQDAGEFLEYANVHGNWYATSSTWLKDQLATGQDVLLEIDWQGARQVRRAMAACTTIFILPPSRAELERRLRARASDNAEAIARRLVDSRQEIAHAGDFDFIVVNDEFADALADLLAIVRCQRLRQTAQLGRHARLIDNLLKID